MFRLIEVISKYENTKKNSLSKEFDRKFKNYNDYLSKLELIQIVVPKREGK